ncbi:MAG: TolC family protein, partial [Oligoflexia bacterium]|nr:TolC family protein [Oligoflexia bacterium]
MRLLKILQVLCCVSGIAAFHETAYGDEPLKINMSSAIKYMIKHSGELMSEKTSLTLAEGRIDQARAALYPKTEVLLLGAPLFEERGNAVSSTKDYGSWGIFGTLRLNVVQALYTFGIVGEYKKAARAGYEVAHGQVETKEADLVYRVKQFMYSMQLANDLFDLVKDGREKIESALKEAEDMVRRNRMKRESLFQLKTYYAQVLAQYDEASRGRELAELALKWTMGIPSGTTIEIEETSIVPEEVELKSLDNYLSEIVSSRPEMKMLTSGIEATRALWQGQAKQKRPVFFALGFANAAGSNVRDDQTSAYANDPYNDLNAGALVGFRFNLDWWSINALSKQSKSEYEKLLFAKDTLVEGMALQVKKAYKEAVDYKNAISYAEEGENNAKKWFLNAAIAYSMGFSEAKDLVESLKAWFEAQFNFNMAIYKYNMA